jgi:hypothetical protein
MYVEVDDLHRSALNALRIRIWLKHTSSKILNNVEEHSLCEDVIAEAPVSEFGGSSP